MGKLYLCLLLGISCLGLGSLSAQERGQKVGLTERAVIRSRIASIEGLNPLIGGLISAEIASRGELSPLIDSLERLSIMDKRGVLTSRSEIFGRVLSFRYLPSTEGSANMIAIIETILQPYPDSRLRLCVQDRSIASDQKEAPEWKELFDISFLEPTPQAEDFFPQRQATSSYAEARLSELLRPLRLVYSWDGTTSDLIIEVSLLQSLEDESNQELQSLIQRLPKLRYEWRGEAFRPK